MFSRLIRLLLLFCLPFGLAMIYNTASAQENAVVTGRVTDKSGNAISEVNVSIFGIPGGVATGPEGRYLLKVQSGVSLELVFSFIGYNTVKIPINLKAGETLTIDQEMEISAKPLPEVQVKDQTIQRGTFIRLDPKTAGQIPNVSGNFEAILKTMPGVVSNNELSSQYSVRGGNYDENLVYVNDIEIYRPMLVRSGQQEGLSFIHPDLVSAVGFSAGGFEANYGDKMSSVLDIKYKTPTKFAGSTYASLLGAGLHLEGITKNKKLSYLFGARYKTSQYLFKSLETKGEYKPAFGDIQALINWNLDSNNAIAFLGNVSYNKYLVIPENRETEFGTINQALRLTIYFDGQEIDEYQTYTGALTYTHKLNKQTQLKLIASAYRSLESESFDIEGQYYIDELESDIGAENFGDVAFNRGIGTYIQHARNELEATVFSFEHKGVTNREQSQTQWGIRYQHESITDLLSEWQYIDSAGYALPHPPDSIGGPGDPDQLIELKEVIKTDTVLSSNRMMAYLMNSWYFGDKDRFGINVGVRVNYWDLNEEAVFSPRATFSFKPDWKRNYTFRLAGGFYYQPPFYRELRNMEGKVNTNVEAQRSIHIIGGMDYVFLSWGREFKFTTEAYYKFLDNLVPYKIDNLRIRYYGENSSHGYATGIDMRINGEFVEGVESWASMSFLKTEEDIEGDFYRTYYNSDGVEIIPGYTANDTPVDSTTTYPGYIPRPTDQRFTFSLFFQDYLPKFPSFKMNMTLVYGSGLPFGPPGTDRYKDTFRVPPYRRVDIGFIKVFIDEDSPKKYRMKFANRIQSLTLGLEVFNLLQVNNTVSYIWVTDVTNRQYAVPNYLSARTLNVRLNVKF